MSWVIGICSRGRERRGELAASASRRRTGQICMSSTVESLGDGRGGGIETANWAEGGAAGQRRVMSDAGARGGEAAWVHGLIWEW
jgi:hypothetical protein